VADTIQESLTIGGAELWFEHGVHEPIWAYVYDTTVVRLSGPGSARRLGRFTEPRIEPEIVLHFRSAPAVSDDPASVLACIDWIAHGIEIVQSHFPGWKFQTADAIADCALHGMLLVGEPQDAERFGADLVSQLERFTITLSRGGNVLGHGRGSNVLGSPLAAAAHLISLLAKQPQAKALQPGELVATGTLTRALPILAGDTWTTALDGIALSGISVTFDP
jgi:2-oxo-3-hexenedioate decarboxylase